MLAFYFFLSGLSLAWASSISLVPTEAVVSRFANASYFVTCRAPGSNLIVWVKDVKQEIPQNSGKVHTESNDGDSLLLVFEGIRKEDKGDYTCKAKYADTIKTQTFSFNVIEPIAFSTSNHMQSAPEGSDYTIRCNVSGDGNITIKLKTHEKKHKELSYQITPEGFLYIQNVTMDYGGRYSCNAVQVSSQLSSFEATDIILKIQHKPRWTNAVEKFVGFIGGTVNLTCSALAEPGAQFIWIKDNETLNNSSFVTISNSDHHSVLQVYVFDRSVFGGYQCRATNIMGTMARIVYLEEASKPFAPTFKILETGGNNLVMTIADSAVVNKDKAVVETNGYVVQYAKSGNDWSESREQQFQISRGQSYTLVNLEPDTSYEVRVAAHTAAGPGDFSDVKTATTKKWVATASPIGTNGSSHGSFSSYFHQWVLTALIAALLAVNICV